MCLDASVVLARLLPHQRTARLREKWLDLVASNEDLIAPPLLLAECTSVIRESVFDRELTPSEALQCITSLLSLPLFIVSNRAVHPLAMSIAERLGVRKAYDAHYLAVADIEGCPLLTVDRRLHRQAISLSIQTELL